MPRKTAEQPICPVCDLPVGKDPHEECLRSLTENMTEVSEPAMPCPACGQPLDPDHNCEA